MLIHIKWKNEWRNYMLSSTHSWQAHAMHQMQTRLQRSYVRTTPHWFQGDHSPETQKFPDNSRGRGTPSVPIMRWAQDCCNSLNRCGPHTHTHTHTHNRFTALFPGPPGWAGARIELLDFMMQGKINGGRHTDHPAGRHSIRTSQCPPPPSPHIFYRPDALPAAQPTASKHWRHWTDVETGHNCFWTL